MNFLSKVKRRYVVSEAQETPYDRVCQEIANDDELFDHIAHYVSGDPEGFNDYPALTKKLESVLKKIPPFKPNKYFYRGESSRKFERTRSVESWTPNKEVAWDFAKNNSSPVMRRTSGPVQGVLVADLCYWRTQVRQGENHYVGDQGEYLLLRPKHIDTVYTDDTGWVGDDPPRK